MTDTDPDRPTEAPDEPANPENPNNPVGSTELKGNTFHGPTALQVGTGNTMNVRYDVTPPTPLDAAADELATVVRRQWEREAGLRRLLEPAPLPVRWQVSDRKVAGRVTGATAEGARARFAPLPGLATATRDDLREGGGPGELHAVYGGLASGRLLLVGPPAAGKTAAAVLLLLDALRYRANTASPDLRRLVPVPVLLSLHGWDPAAESPADWAAGQLSREYTLFRGRGGRVRALELLESGRIALFLDALDEVGGKLRTAMVSALESADFRLVLVSRSKEAVLASRRARLSGAVALEILPVRPADAAAYLLGPLPDPPPPDWKALTDALLDAPDSVVARALSSPLAISLLRDVYGDSDPVDELLDPARFPTPRAVEDHLLDHAVIAAYTARPGRPRPRHSPEAADRALRHLAVRLTEQGTRDLLWWHIPSWTDRRPRAIAVGAVVGLVYGVATFFLSLRLSGPVWAGVMGPVSAIASGCVAGLLSLRSGDPQPLPSAGWRDIFGRTAVRRGVVQWLVTAVAIWLCLGVVPLMDPGLPAWLCFLSTIPTGFATTLIYGRGIELVAGNFLGRGAKRWFDDVKQDHDHTAPPVVDSRSVGPREVWLHHIRLRLLLGLLVGLAVALLFVPISTWQHGFWAGAPLGVGAGLWIGLVSGPVTNLGVATAMTAVQLSAAEGTPVRLMAFLEDARRRNLLRATGPVYQFRHARLQERLALPRSR
ncbi:hypothetical protein [Streptomyces sp. GQFP]|uniref:hypothetical protein n=1 Tax=Streptomyces sp. GQFP TaxID=2907545 RepID=UPI001F4847A4|nr:hypothetical protein [Streptomyces sp. GQFP]UIX34968.1 hypothetical protein LUX31_35965 [Streptomyces sp. GQFP]